MAAIWDWILILMFGTGAVITPAPVTLYPGSTFYRAEKALKPVDDSVRVGIDLGPVTEEKEKEILSGLLDMKGAGCVRVAICTSQTECIPMSFSGPYFSHESYGIGFEASGSRLRHASFVGVRVQVDRPLGAVTISWSNYVQ